MVLPLEVARMAPPKKEQGARSAATARDLLAIEAHVVLPFANSACHGCRQMQEENITAGSFD
jgi:hypothetical protein